MKTSDLLRLGKTQIQNPDKWTKKTFHDGDKHCAIGSIMHLTGDSNCYQLVSMELLEAEPYLDEASRIILNKRGIDWRHQRVYDEEGHSSSYSVPTPYVNDVLGHEAVMELYDIAIELAVAHETPVEVPVEKELVIA